MRTLYAGLQPLYKRSWTQAEHDADIARHEACIAAGDAAVIAAVEELKAVRWVYPMQQGAKGRKVYGRSNARTVRQ